MVRVNHLNPNPKLEMFLKLEKFNPGGSVKDRITKYMIEKAEENGQLKKGMTVIEPTSGNTGIGLALVCRVKGYDLALVMPDTMTRERRQILLTLGAKVILSEGSKGMDGAEDLAHEIVNQHPSQYFLPNQFACMHAWTKRKQAYAKKLPSNTRKISLQDSESADQKDSSTQFQTLVRNHALPQHERHHVGETETWTQKHKQYSSIRPASGRS